MRQICSTLSYLAKQFVEHDIHHFFFLDVSLRTCDAHRKGVSPFTTILGLYWDSPLHVGLEAAVHRAPRPRRQAP